MKNTFVIFSVLLALFILQGCGAKNNAAEGISSDIYAVTDNGIGEKLGIITAADTADGLSITVDVKNIPEGKHGFHIHANPSCEAVGADGKKGAALAAGGHYDPMDSKIHSGPYGDGHKGDLPLLEADANGVI